jgi:23S rRNA-/tRNA-specific pseudouridylate synthase
MKLHDGVEVISISPKGLWAFYKPSGVLSHPNGLGDQDKSLIEAPYDFDEEAFVTEDGLFYLLHRLDGPTSGVILGTPYAAMAREVKELMRARKVKKTYLAVVAGQPRKDREMWIDKLSKHKANAGNGVHGNFGRGVRAEVVGGGAPAETQMYVVKKYGKPLTSALLELHPLTGRTHQLRIQCARRQMPIIGDATYGDFNLNRQLKAKTLLLHAQKIEIPELKYHAECPPPKEFAKWGR